jgi:hypothetical protein
MASRPDVDVTKVFRDQIDLTALDLRLESKRGVEILGKEMESTVSELRGTISALALQVECGVSGSTSALADAVAQLGSLIRLCLVCSVANLTKFLVLPWAPP